LSSSILNDYPKGSIREAVAEYEARTLKNATQAREVDVYAPEGILTELGPVHAITYSGTLQGDTELYEHTFNGGASPDLMVDAQNTLHLVGGEYHVSDLGIEDGEGPAPRANPAFSKAPLGSGGRFDACVAKVSGKRGVYDPEGLCASIGRKKYGAKKMAAMAKAGRRNPTDGKLPIYDVGQRVALQADVERFPHFIAQEGSTGVVTESTPDLLTVKMTHHLPGAEDWDNKIVWTDDDAYHGDLPPLNLRGSPALYETSPEHADDTEGWDWPPENLPLLGAVAFQSRFPHAGSPYIYGILERHEKDERPGKLKENEELLIEAMRLYPERFEVTLGRYLGRKYRFLWDPTYRENPVSANEARKREHAATTEAERHYWRRMKGQARQSNPVVTNRVSSNSPVVNAGVLAMAMPGGSPYGLPQVNAGALAAGPNYPGNYDFPGVTNGSHGLLGPQIRRNVPGQPIANPVNPKKIGKWTKDPAHGIDYGIDADNEGWAQIFVYKPRSRDPVVAWNSRSNAGAYEQATGQKPPKGTKYIVRVMPPGAGWGEERWSAHKTLAPAKRRAEKELRIPAR
jgi:hypothetical protein